MKKLPAIILFCFFSVFHACKDNISGDMIPNRHPETYTIVDSIIRYGNDRFKSQIEIHWWGDDPDGYVQGYEISFDKMVWIHTQRQDSVFIVKIPEGKDTFDFSFYVRAVDNAGMRDPTPAEILYPVKNSPPTIAFQYPDFVPKRIPKKSFPVLKFSWEAQDPDGVENISHYELFLNDTLQEALIIEAHYSSVIIQADNFNTAIVPATVYKGAVMNQHARMLPNMLLNDTNQLIIRAVDLVGEKSDFAFSNPIFVRKPESKTLLINTYSYSVQQFEDFYTSNMNIAGIHNYEITRLNEIIENTYTELAPDNITQAMIFDLFDVLIWFGKDAAYTLSLAQRTTDNFISKGGKMFIAVELSSSMEPQANYLNFTPIDSLVEPPANKQFILSTDSLLLPVNTAWPQLKASQIINPTRPFYQELASEDVYNARIIEAGTTLELWKGKSTLMAMRKNQGQCVFFISSVELHKINGNGNIDLFFRKLFIDEFGL
jgi:hypothetical protein